MASSERLRGARSEAGHASAAAAARAFGWNEGSYRHHENGTRGFDSDQAKAYAKAYNVSASWLMGLSSTKLPDSYESTVAILETFDPPTGIAGDLEQDLIENFDAVLVRTVSIEDIAAHGPSGIFSFATSYIPISKRIVDGVAKASFRDIVALFIDNTEMEPTIKIGDLILIDTAQRQPIHQDQIWLMSQAGRVMVRRLRYDDATRATGWADDKRVASISVDTLQSLFYIHGRVVWTGSTL